MQLDYVNVHLFLFIFSFIIILFLFLFDECGICGECELFACGVGLGVYLYMLPMAGGDLRDVSDVSDVYFIILLLCSVCTYIYIKVNSTLELKKNYSFSFKLEFKTERNINNTYFIKPSITIIF